MNTNLKVRPGNRWCVVEKRARFALDEIQTEILRHADASERFTRLGTPAPARDQTIFKAYTDGKELMIAVAVFDSVVPTTRCEVVPLANRHSLEIFFAPWNDELGWFQFCFPPSGPVQAFRHLPYPEALSTAMPLLKVSRFQWGETARRTPCRLYWLFAWFPLKEVFRKGEVCGFNVARYSPPIEEYSSWNHSSAVGTQDATCFGKLHLKPAPALGDVRAVLEGNRVFVEGKVSGGARNLRMEMINPVGAKIAMTSRTKGNLFRAEARIAKRVAGNYRLRPFGADGVMEPEDFSFDLVSAEQAKKFQISVTYDMPDNLAFTNYYTPARIESELSCWQKWGIHRIYWIEYGALSRWESLWDQLSGDLARKEGQDHVALTRKHLDNLLLPAARGAKKLGMDFFGVFKPFDMGFNTFVSIKDDGRSSLLEKEENRYTIAMPEVVSHPELLMQRHPDWRRRDVFPITRVVFYSENQIPAFAASKLKLWTSRDNQHYTPYRKAFQVKQGTVRRPHYRWTPAGKVAESENAVNWQIEISNLDIRAPYLALEIEGQDFEVSHRAFAFVEAWSEGKAIGSRQAPVTLSSGGDRQKGFLLGKGPWTWANNTMPIADIYSWKGGAQGLLFREEWGPSNLLEPSYAGTRKIWLDQVRRILESEADGVDIRTLGHHNTTMSYLACAFAEPVREAFRRQYGRAVEPTQEDYVRVRKLRGAEYTKFLREAKALASKYRKKLSAHLEWGIEVPTHLDVRMAMELDWQTWIGEKIVDEVSLRGWGSQNAYMQRNILPLARRMNVPVHVISQCLNGGMDIRAMELCERYVTEACAAGLAGFSLYESSDLLRMNTEGVPMPIGCVDEAVQQARCALDCIGLTGK